MLPAGTPMVGLMLCTTVCGPAGAAAVAAVHVCDPDWVPTVQLQFQIWGQDSAALRYVLRFISKSL